LGQETLIEVVRKAGDDAGWHLAVDALWADASACDGGIRVRAFDEEGREIPVEVIRHPTQGYEVRANTNPRRLDWLPKDGFRDWDDAVSIETAALASGSRVASFMRPGADLVILVPGSSGSVLLRGPFGAEVFDVPRLLRLRALAPGRYAGRHAGLERTVEIAGASTFCLDFGQ